MGLVVVPYRIVLQAARHVRSDHVPLPLATGAILLAQDEADVV